MRGMKKPVIVVKASRKPAGAMKALAAIPLPAGPVPPTPGPPDASAGPLQAMGNGAADAEPPMPPAGATDGLGAGQGGLAIHPSLKGHNIGGYESRHTSKTR
jgi:hypothetical protein